MAEKETHAPFIPLASYKTPSLPVVEGLQATWLGWKELWHRDEQEPLIKDDRLRGVTTERLNQVVAPPACGPVLAEMGVSFNGWLQQATGERLQTVVLPPCEQSGVVRAWAKEQGCEVLEPPPRAALLAENFTPPSLAGEGVLVVPNLEHWFLRHTRGLRYIRWLLDAITHSERRMLISCNSWAWLFLVKTMRIDALLPTPQIFNAFTAKRLKQWFSAIAHSSGAGVAFIDTESGDEVLAEVEGAHDRLTSLAAKSQGIPWVAWHMWRHSLREELEAEEGEKLAKKIAAKQAEEEQAEARQTLWVAALNEYSLPGYVGDDSLFILHTLLLHDGLTKEHLALTLPFAGAYNTANGLLMAGLVYMDEQQELHCTPEAYPAICQGLKKAGFPEPSI